MGQNAKIIYTDNFAQQYDPLHPGQEVQQISYHLSIIQCCENDISNKLLCCVIGGKVLQDIFRNLSHL